MESQVAEGDVVVTLVTAKGTHRGEFLSIPLAEKVIVIEGVNIDRIAGGKIVEHWGAANTLEALHSTGAPGKRLSSNETQDFQAFRKI